MRTGVSDDEEATLGKNGAELGSDERFNKVIALALVLGRYEIKV